MRLSAEQIAGIKSAALDVFGPDAIVRLFGSRADDDARGGDIDLHLLVAPEMATIDHEVRFRSELWKRLDEPQIDVVIAARDAGARWIDRAALREGVVL